MVVTTRKTKYRADSIFFEIIFGPLSPGPNFDFLEFIAVEGRITGWFNPYLSSDVVSLSPIGKNRSKMFTRLLLHPIVEVDVSRQPRFTQI